MTAAHNTQKSIVLIGLMGAGKSSLGRRLATRVDLPFIDTDDEVVKAAGCSIEDIFELYGEAAFRDTEHRVITRLLKEGPKVLATGGGAFMDSRTRAKIATPPASDARVREAKARHAPRWGHSALFMLALC